VSKDPAGTVAITASVTVPGTPDEMNGRTPMSGNSAPSLSTEQVEALLKQKLQGRVWNIRVLVEEGCVVLQGQARSYYAKQLAQHIAMEIIQLRIRANEIEVG
jgi:osmotically-inducible protein OsmY